MRFQSRAGEYAAYLETPEGRLRSDLAFGNLAEFLPRTGRALDLGCGTGEMGARLARLGYEVTLLDAAPAMLEIAQRTGAAMAVKLGDAAEAAAFFPADSFDVIVCHNLLEYVDDPGAVLRAAAQVMSGPAAILSVLVRNRAGEVLKAALQAGDLAGAEEKLTAEWGVESLYGGKVRLFAADGVRTMLKAEGLRVMAERGVRVVSDYLPPGVSRGGEYERILELERKLGRRPEFAAMARYSQWIVNR